MIADRLGRWNQYFASASWRRAFEFIQGLDVSAAEGRFELDGRNVFALVMSYETRADSNGAILESHREYIDIQAALNGPERIAWYPVESLRALGPYNVEQDVVHYAHPDRASAEVFVEPGSFVVLYPTDAHMPQLAASAPRLIKKVVVKVRVAAAGEPRA